MMVEKGISQALLNMLRCPACDDRPELELREGKLLCSKYGRAYPIKDAVPIMLAEEAEKMGEAQ
jgi:uncharacterized protein YbaR (Trm112 family)